MHTSAVYVPAAVAAGIAITLIFGAQVAIAALVLAIVILIAAAVYDRRAVPLTRAPLTDSAAGREMLARELGRSRRYGRSLVLMRASVRSTPADRKQLLAALAACVRTTDHAWVESGDMYVAMPEAAHSDAQRLGMRMREAALEARGELSFTVGVFPDDALSGSALLEFVQRDDLAPMASPRVVEQARSIDGSALSR